MTSQTVGKGYYSLIRFFDLETIHPSDSISQSDSNMAIHLTGEQFQQILQAIAQARTQDSLAHCKHTFDGTRVSRLPYGGNLYYKQCDHLH